MFLIEFLLEFNEFGHLSCVGMFILPESLRYFNSVTYPKFWRCRISRERCERGVGVTSPSGDAASSKLRICDTTHVHIELILNNIVLKKSQLIKMQTNIFFQFTNKLTKFRYFHLLE
jgi:hypothetical protein